MWGGEIDRYISCFFLAIEYHRNRTPLEVSKGGEMIMAGRPPKEPGQRMNVPLKIMLTQAQHDLIRQAAQDRDVSSWARPILLQAARKSVARASKKG